MVRFIHKMNRYLFGLFLLLVITSPSEVSSTTLFISNVNNVSNFYVDNYIADNFVIYAKTGGTIDTNITARIYIYAKRKGTSGEYTIDSTSTSVDSKNHWEESGSLQYAGHTLLIKGECVLEQVSDSEDGDVRIFVSDARDNVEKMTNTYFDVTFKTFDSTHIGKIVINEVNYDTGYIWQKEWVEFYNTTSTPIDMNGFNLRASIDKNNFITSAHTIPSTTTTIPAHGYLILVANMNYFTNFFSWVKPGQGDYINTVIVEKNVNTKSFRSNTTTGFYNHTYRSGDTMFLIDSSSNIIEELSYKHSWKPDVENISIERRDSNGLVNSDGNWGGSIDTTGSTPGKVNSIYIGSSEVDASSINYLEVSKKIFNPKQESIKVYYKLNNSSHIKITVYNTEGILMDELYNSDVASGTGYVTFDGKDRVGNYLSTGVYIIYMEIIENNKITKVSKTVVINSL